MESPIVPSAWSGSISGWCCVAWPDARLRWFAAKSLLGISPETPRSFRLSGTYETMRANPIEMLTRYLMLIVTAAMIARAQEFEVASIKANHSGRQGFDGFEAEHGSLTVRNASLKMLIEAAYSTQDERIFGGPAWLASDRFDVMAKGRSDATKAEVWLMLRELLADRFKLVTRNEQRELPFYALEIAKESKLPKGSGPPCDEQPAKLGEKFTAPCGNLVRAWGPQGGVVVGNRVSIATLADALAGFLGRPIVDRTGFKGTIDVNLRWTPEGYAVRAGGDNESQRSAAPPEPGPSLFSAIQEQLGLKLVSTKGPIDALVVERAEKPTEN
jgi:uncharacterized protein (TIGR03435 family)